MPRKYNLFSSSRKRIKNSEFKLVSRTHSNKLRLLFKSISETKVISSDNPMDVNYL